MVLSESESESDSETEVVRAMIGKLVGLDLWGRCVACLVGFLPAECVCMFLCIYVCMSACTNV